MNRKFRKAALSDKEAVYSLFQSAQAKLESWGNYMWSKGYPSQDDFNHDIEEGQMILVEEDDKIVASISYNLDPLTYFYWESKDEEKLEKVFKAAGFSKDEKVIIPERLMVHPDYQGKGIATSLFAYLHEAFPEHSWLYAVFLSDTNALRLYRHLGYTEIGVFPDFEWGEAAKECTVFAKKW